MADQPDQAVNLPETSFELLLALTGPNDFPNPNDIADDIRSNMDNIPNDIDQYGLYSQDESDSHSHAPSTDTSSLDSTDYESSFWMGNFNEPNFWELQGYNTDKTAGSYLAGISNTYTSYDTDTYNSDLAQPSLTGPMELNISQSLELFNSAQHTTTVDACLYDPTYVMSGSSSQLLGMLLESDGHIIKLFVRYFTLSPCAITKAQFHRGRMP